MASSTPTAEKRAKPNVNENKFPVWRDSFDDETRHKQFYDDSDAWRSVTALLIAIVIGGLILGLTAVTIISRFQL
jgi:hypothetical protein